MIAMRLPLILSLLILLFFHLNNSIDLQEEEDYDYGDSETLEDCQYEIDFKTFKKTNQLKLCSTLINASSSSKSRLQLHLYANHTDEKIRLRAISSSSLINSKMNRSLISLTTDINEDFKYVTSLVVIDDYQFLSLSTLQSILKSIIQIDANLLNKNLKKTLIVAKGGHKELLSCSGNLYPKQDVKLLEIPLTLNKSLTCNKERQKDRFFTLQEKMFINQINQKDFHLIQIHQDDSKKISRTVWYTCNNPTSCSNGIQNKQMIDKTANYVWKYLQKGRTEKKTTSSG